MANALEDLNRIQSDFPYSIKSRYNGVTYIKCAASIKLQCPARGNIDANGRLLWTIDHNHAKNPNEQLIKLMKKDLYESVVSGLHDLRILYDRIALLHPIAASFITFRKVEDCMLRWREKCRPTSVRTLRDYVHSINLDKWISYGQYSSGTLLVHSVLLNNQTIAAIIGDSDFLRSLHVDNILIDATFEVCPRKISKNLQLLTIMGKVQDVFIPLTWALMTEKSTIAYTQVLNFFSTRFAPNIRPRTVTIDFEAGLSAAIQQIYPNTIITRCYFHFMQAMMRRLKKKGKVFMERMRTWKEGQIFYRKLLAIPLLPAQDIITAYTWLITNTVADVLNKFADFTTYFNNWWLVRVTPEKLSVFLAENIAASSIEAYHRVLRKRIGISHPSIWQLTIGLRNLQSITKIEWSSTSMGLSVRRQPADRWIKLKEIRNRAWELLSQNYLDIPLFLACVCNFLRVFQECTLINEVNDVDLFVNVPNHDIGVHVAPNNNMILPVRNERYNIPKLPASAPMIGDNIFLLRNLNTSKCSICQQRVCNYVSWPCCHWFGCNFCVESVRRLLMREEADVICPYCNNFIVAFKGMNIT